MNSNHQSYAHDRIWREFHPASEREFTVMTWNVLADGLADGLAESGGFLHTPMEALQWAFRADSIVRQILSGEHTGSAPRLICLQEVDHFADSLEPAPHQAGFSGAFVPKTEGRDGSCVFWNRERFAVRWIRPLRFVGDCGASSTQVALLVALIHRLDERPLTMRRRSHEPGEVFMEGSRPQAFLEGNPWKIKGCTVSEGQK